jgi:hypothetical protein
LTAAEAKETSKRARIPDYEKILAEILTHIQIASEKGKNQIELQQVLAPEFVVELRSLGYGVKARNHETTITW